MEQTPEQKEFEHRSGYARRALSKSDFPLLGCCGGKPRKTGRAVRERAPEGDERPFPVFCCEICGELMIEWEGRFRKLGPALRYRFYPEETNQEG